MVTAHNGMRNVGNEQYSCFRISRVLLSLLKILRTNEANTEQKRTRNWSIDAHGWTLKSNRGYQRRLDYIIGDWYIKKATVNCRSYPSVISPFESDHRVLVMDAMLPTRRTRHEIFKKKKESKQPPYVPNVRSLRDSETIRNQYSDRVERIWKQQLPSDQVDAIDRQVVDAITKASSEVIPERKKDCYTKPWANNEFLELITKCPQVCNPIERKELSKQIRKMRIALKNKYFREKAQKINVASEQRNAE